MIDFFLQLLRGIRKQMNRKKFLILKFLILVFLYSCADEEVTFNEGVDDDGSPLTSSEALSAGFLPEDNALDFSTPPELSAIEGDEYEVTAYALNVRKGPGLNYPIVRIIYKGNLVEGLRTDSKWIQIDKFEYVSGRYLRRFKR